MFYTYIYDKIKNNSTHSVLCTNLIWLYLFNPIQLDADFGTQIQTDTNLKINSITNNKHNTRSRKEILKNKITEKPLFVLWI